MFNIPKNIGDFTTEALARMRAEAAQEYNATLAAFSADPSSATDEGLGRLDALLAFATSVDEILTPQAGTEGDATTENEDQPAADRLSAFSPIDPPAAQAPGVGDVAPSARSQEAAEDASASDRVFARCSLVAAAGLPGYANGQDLTDIGGVAEAINRQLRGVTGAPQTGFSSQDIAGIVLPDSTYAASASPTDNRALLRELTDERRLPGGSLVAARLAQFEQAAGGQAALVASGWCAPSEVDYSIKYYGGTQGLFDAPMITAPRGGLWVMPELDFSTVYGTPPGSSYFNFTEAQIIAGAVKTFVDIPCPDPTEYRLGVIGFGAVAPLLALRAYPENTSEYVRASLIGLQRLISAVNIAEVVLGSTAINLSAVAPWVSDGSVVSQMLAAGEMAAVDQRIRGGYDPDSTIEQVWPYWVLAQARADWIRRNGAQNPFLADLEIMRQFAALRIAPQFVMMWQDFWTSGAGFPGDDPTGGGVVTQLPTSVSFLSYPVGTWVHATLPVITLRGVFDSVRLSSNERIEIFTEQGRRMIKRRTDSRVYTLAICPTGATGEQREVACTTEPT